MSMAIKYGFLVLVYLVFNVSNSIGNTGGTMYNIEQITEPSTLGEGPHWISAEQALYYVDISGYTVHKHDFKTKKNFSLKLGNTIGAIVPIQNNPGKFVIGYRRNLTILEWDGKSADYKLQNKYEVDKDKPGNRFNDGKADANGNLWFGTMGPEIRTAFVEPDQGTLYRVAAKSCKLEAVVSPVSLSNGMTWNSDNTIMYYIDTPDGKVYAFDYDLNTAKIDNKRTFFDFVKQNLTARPDGMTIDCENNLWIANVGDGKVHHVSKEGKLIKNIQLPVPQATSVAWGGPNFDILFVTTIRDGLTEEQIEKQPGAGAVFAITGLGAKGSELYSASDCLLAKKCF